MSGAEDDPDLAGEDGLPANDAVGADEAMTWLALGKAVRLGTWQGNVYGFSRIWPLPDLAFFRPQLADPLPLLEWPWGPALLHAGLLAEAAGLGWRRGLVSAMPQYQDLSTWLMESLLAKAPAADLAAALAADLGSVARVNARLRRAAATLRDASQAKLVQVLAAPVEGAGSERTPAPSEGFHFGTEICPESTLREVGSHKVLLDRLLFRVADLPALRRSGRPSSSTLGADLRCASGVSRPRPADPAAWMRDHLEAVHRRTGSKAKMEDSVKECRDSTGRDIRAAWAAWKAAPDHLKRPSRGPKQRKAS